MKLNSLHRGMALLLAACMTLTMNSGFAFAADVPLPTEAGTTETSSKASVMDSGQGELTDPMGSVTEGGIPFGYSPVCTCDSAPGTSSVEGHGEDCPLYAPPEQVECTCPPVDSGEVVHGEGCPLYEKPAVPEIKCVCTVLCTAEAANVNCSICAAGFERCGYAAPVPTEAMNAVYALIDALPSLEELEAAFTLDSGTPPDMDKLQADAQAARAAYDALSDAEKAAFDDLRLQKLEAIEGLFAASLMAVTDAKPAQGDGTQGNPWQVTSEAELSYVMHIRNRDNPIYLKIMNPFTVSAPITPDYSGLTFHLDGNGQEITYSSAGAASATTGFGIFYCYGGVIINISNLGVCAAITGNYTAGIVNVGGFFSSIANNSIVTMTNCYLRGEIAATSNKRAEDRIAGIAPTFEQVTGNLKNVAVDLVPQTSPYFTTEKGKDTPAGYASFAFTGNTYRGSIKFENCWYKQGSHGVYANTAEFSSTKKPGEPVTSAAGASSYDTLQSCVDSMNASIATDKNESLNTWVITDGHLAFGEKWKAELKMDTGTATMNGRTATFPSFAVVSPSGNDIKTVSVQLAAGRQAGDTLALPSPASGFAVNTYNEGAKLTLTATGQTDAAWTTELKKLTVTLGAGDSARDIRFECSSSTATTTSDAVYNKQNGHYYKLASASSWAAAKSAADGSVLALGNNWKGYLATITSKAEWDFVQNTFGGVRAFVGGSSDSADISLIISSITSNGRVYDNSYSSATSAQGKFHWISGPEKGMRFWHQIAPRPRFSSAAIPGGASGSNYTAFATDEPNNYYAVNEGKPETGDKWVIKEDERYLAIGPSGWADVSANGSDGTWANGSNVKVSHYLIEFGGMEADEKPPVAESFKVVSATITPSGMTVTPTPDPIPEKPTVTPDPPAPAPAPGVDNTNHLTSLYATAGGKTYSVTPTFDHALRTYSMVVPTDTASVTPGVTYTGAGTVAGLASVSLGGKETTFTVTFTVGGTAYAYTVTVLKSAEAGNAAGDPPADLTGLAVSEVVGGYTFAPATYTYPSIVVKNAATSVAVMPAFSGSTVTVNGTTATSGMAVAVPLNASGTTTVLVNVAGTDALSKTYMLTIAKNTAVAITATPTHATTYGGADGKITVTASGGQGTYEYSKDNSTWQDANTFTGLTAGAYTVYARDKVDTANVSAGTAVTVQQPAATPSITPGANQTVTYGTAATVSVTATAADNGTLTYQWSKDGTAISGAANASYTDIPNLVVGTYSYTCEVTNTKLGTTNGFAKATSTAITVTVNKATPTLTLTVDKTAPTYGEEITLTATVAKAGGGTYPASTVTFKDGTTTIATTTLANGTATTTYKIPVIHGELTASYAGDINYGPQDATSPTVTVAPKPLTVTAVAQAITYGDAAPAYTASYSAFAFSETETALDGTLALACPYRQFDDATSYSITPSGLTSDNYAITFTNGTLTVGKKTLGLSWSGADIREYDGEPSNVTATATGLLNGDTVGVTATSGTAATVGTHTATATALSNATSTFRAFFGATDKSGNYQLPTAVTQPYTIDPRTITMALDVATFEYDGTEKTVTATVTNPVVSEIVTVALTGDKQTNVGNHTATAVTLAGTDAGNYRIGTPAPTATWEITGKAFPFTVTPPTASGITYGDLLSASTLTGNNSEATVRFSLFALLDAQNAVKTGSFAWKDGTKKLDAGEQTATAVFTPDDTNYSPMDCPVDIAVAKKGVTLTATGTKVYGTAPIEQDTFTITPTTSDMVYGETGIALLGTLELISTGNTADAPVASYDITVAQSGESNYEVTTYTVANGFTVTAATITGITVTPYNGVYDGEAHPAVTVTGTQTGDIVQYQLDSPGFSTTVPTIKDVGSSAVMVKITRANYADYTPNDTFTANVTKKEVAVTFTVPTNLVYDGNVKTVTTAITNICGADDVSLILGNASGMAVGKYTTTVSALGGAAAVNYKLPTTKPFVRWEITGTPYPHAITLPTATGITYGQKLSDSTLTGDNGGTGGFTWNDPAIMPPAGSYTATVVFTPNDTNFAPVTRTVQVTVAKADVTLEVSGTKAYHAAPIANSDFVVSNIAGMVNGETDPTLLGALTLTSTGNTNTATVGRYDIAIAQSGTSNYKITTTSVTNGFTVTRATQTLSGIASYNLLLTDKDFALDIKTDSTDADAAVTYTLTNSGGGAVKLTDGKVLIEKIGTATITASAAQTANFEAAPDLTITVTVGSMPSVRIQAPEGITTTEAQIGGTVTAGTVPMTGYGLEYKKSADADYTAISPTETVNGNVTKLTHSLAGLEKNTEYSVRIWAKTADKPFESVTHFRTAAEQPPTGKVEGEITDNSGENTAITVTIEEGNTIIASKTVTAGGGKFTFEALPDGFYNLVADNGKYKVTRMVEIVKGGAVTDVMMEIGKKQSVVEVIGGGTPNVAVDGLPELFENDTLYPQADKDVISAGGTVEFKLTVEQTDDTIDAEEIGKIAEGKIGAYLDIRVLKTVTDLNGREQESTLIADLGINEITIVIPLAKELQGKASYTVYRVHGGSAEKLESAYNVASNTLTIKSSLFSTYAIAYTEKSGGDGGSGGGNSHDDDNYNFWQKVKDKIENAKDGGGLPLGYTVKAGAGSYDKMPESVMDALRKNPKVTLEITWNGGDKITIPAGGALEKDGLRFYYPLAYLVELYRNALPAELPSANKTNPETGGVWEVNAPATAVQAPAIITPKNEGTAATPKQAELERAAIKPQTAPEIATIPDIAEAADGTPNRSKAMLFTGITIMLAAAAVACGVIIWKKKHKEEAFK